MTLPPAIALQYLLPKKLLTVLAGRVAAMEGGAFTHALIRRFVARYRVDMQEAADSRIESYRSFNEFFTRPLRPGVRPLSDAPWVCPVDGAISQCGPIEGDQIFQAKGHRYSTRALVGGDAALAGAFENGRFATIYLSPRDYHRIHMPCEGRLRRMIYVPGDLFSVNPLTARHVPGLFARNERVVCEFECAQGPLVMVLVGATIVGSVATVWHGRVHPPRSRDLREWRYDDRTVRLPRGAEMGRFLLGSTVVLLLPRGTPDFAPAWSAGAAVQLGQPMAGRAEGAP